MPSGQLIGAPVLQLLYLSPADFERLGVSDQRSDKVKATTTNHLQEADIIDLPTNTRLRKDKDITPIATHPQI